MFERLDSLYAIGDGPGANRPHGSSGEDEAHELAVAALAPLLGWWMLGSLSERRHTATR
jgi:hypothetical protein